MYVREPANPFPDIRLIDVVQLDDLPSQKGYLRLLFAGLMGFEPKSGAFREESPSPSAPRPTGPVISRPLLDAESGTDLLERGLIKVMFWRYPRGMLRPKYGG